VCDDPIEDTWPPCYSNWIPSSDLIHPGRIVGVSICDLCPEAEYSTGVNPESIDFGYTLGDDPTWFPVTDFTLDPIHCLGYALNWTVAGLPPGERVNFCVEAEDFVGNRSGDCNSFIVASTPDSTDLWPPIADWWETPEGDTVMPGYVPYIHLNVCDDYPEAEVYTGVYRESISLLLYVDEALIGDVIDDCVVTPLEPDCAGFAIDFYGDHPLPVCSEITLCIIASDNAGNELEDCITFWVACPPDTMDLIPPFATNWSPEDSMVDVGLYEPVVVDLLDLPGESSPASGIDSLTIGMTIYHEGIPGPADLTPFLEIIAIEHGFRLTFEHAYPFPEEAQITITVYADDLAGNHLVEETHQIIFWTESLIPPPDSLGPEADIVHPLNGTWSACADQMINIHLSDPNGIDLSTIQIDVDGASYNIESEELNWIAPYQLLQFSPSSDWESGDIINVSLNSADDSLGNPLQGAPIVWSFGIDLNAPAFFDPYPAAAETIYAPTHLITIQIADDLSGIHPASPRMWMNREWYTLDYPGLTFYPETGLLEMEMSEILYHPDSEGLVNICVTAHDQPDYCPPNDGEFCWSFILLDTTHLDIYPPCVEDWMPIPGSEGIPPNTPIGASICDICESAEFATGVDPESIEMLIVIHSDGYLDTVDVSEYLILEPIDCEGYHVYYPAPEFGYPAGAMIWVLLCASDFAGNHICEDMGFHIAPDTPTDTIPPVVAEHHPPAGAEDVPIDTEINIWLCDFPGTYHEFISGVDEASILVTLQVGSEGAVDITGFCEIIPNRCYGYTINYITEPPFPAHAEITVCVEADDHAGNHLEYCFSFFTGVYLPPDTSDHHGPYGEGWIPRPGASGVDPSAAISVRILDCIGEHISGVDISTIRMTLDVLSDPEPPADITDELIMEPDECLGFLVSYIPDPPLPSRAEIMVLIEAQDYAGNPLYGGFFTHFWTSSTEPDTSEFYYLTGTVVEAVSGAPLEGIMMYAFPFLSEYDHGFTGETNEFGNYIIGVPRGEYCLAALDMDMVFFPEFYDGHRDPFEADIIRIYPISPDTIYGLDFFMDSISTRFYRISGQIEDAIDPHPIPRAFVIAVSSEEDEEWAFSSFSDDSGHYSLKVLNGDYYILGFRPGYIPLFYNDVLTWEEATAIEVDGEDVPGIDIHLPPIFRDTTGLEIEGYIYDGGDLLLSAVYPTLRGARLYLIDQDNQPVTFTASDPEGYFHLTNVPEGVYRLQADKTDFYSYEEHIYFDESIFDLEITLYRVMTNVFDENTAAVTPSTLGLEQNYPNPFNPVTYIRYNVPATSKVTLEVYDILGNRVKQLVDAEQERGRYLAVWEATELSSGIYFCKLQVGGRTESIRMNLIK
ncbi:T9SS type A sorting domain-containing protein, partial [bacterium]|nr:T9SS type A sorting domain-containing protein [bacterium]